MKGRFLILGIFLMSFLIPTTQAVPLIEVFVANGDTIHDIVDDTVLEDVESGEAILILSLIHI